MRFAEIAEIGSDQMNTILTAHYGHYSCCRYDLRVKLNNAKILCLSAYPHTEVSQCQSHLKVIIALQSQISQSTSVTNS